MTIETALYPSQFNTTLPPQSDFVREGAGHLRQNKIVWKTTFSQISGPVTASHTELSYVTGVTSPIQPQLAAKSIRAGDTYTGTHDYTGATVQVPTMPPGTSSTAAASTAFVIAQGLSGTLPGQSGQAGKYIRTDGTNASWQAAVSSLNGATGNLSITTLSGYGITDFKLQTSGNADLNTLTTPGQYRFRNAAPNSPPGVIESVVNVSRGEDTGHQIAVDYLSGALFSRGFVDPGGGNPIIFFPWRRALLKNEPAVAVSGTSINVASGTYFTDTVSANKTYSFANAMTGDSLNLEITHTGGAIAFNSVIWPGSAAPSLSTNRRHLFFFQLASNGNAWFGSYLGNYPT